MTRMKSQCLRYSLLQGFLTSSCMGGRWLAHNRSTWAVECLTAYVVRDGFRRSRALPCLRLPPVVAIRLYDTQRSGLRSVESCLHAVVLI